MLKHFLLGCVFIGVTWNDPTAAAEGEFRVGVARRDITPEAGLPMWGYGARHAARAEGALDNLLAKAIVIHAGGDKLAIVAVDLGRGPTAAMMARIRGRLKERAGIEHVMVCGSHTHHGPVIELTDREGFGRGTFDDAVEYSRKLPEWIIAAVTEADADTQPACFGVASRDTSLNRNRHSRRETKMRDPRLAVIRFDSTDGEPIAVLVNFAAHPVMTDGATLKYSADYPGFLQAYVEEELGAACLFVQGAAGDMSVRPPDGIQGPRQYGEELGRLAVQLARAVETRTPVRPKLRGRVNRYRFASRVDFANPLVNLAYQKAFFPELIRNFVEELRDGIKAETLTVVLGNQLALVGASGEFFSGHARRLRQRSYLEHTLFFGYCNGHHLYFPTIEAASEGGYGAGAIVSPVEIGAGERMMNDALVNIYALTGRLPDAGTVSAPAEPAQSTQSRAADDP